MSKRDWFNIGVAASWLKKLSYSNSPARPDQLIPLRQIAITPAAEEVLQRASIEPSALLMRHVKGDWGDLTDDDRQVNNDALKTQSQVLSSYNMPNGEKIWVITDPGWQVTTILTPDDY